MQKEWWEMIECWWFFSSSARHFFNEIAIFSANVPHMISQPTDQFLHYNFCRSLVIIKKQLRHKKNGEKWLSVDDFSVLLLTPFFNEIAIFSANAPHMILQPTDQSLPCCICHPLTIIKKQQWHKKNGEKELSVDYFSVFLLIFFQWNCYF